MDVTFVKHANNQVYNYCFNDSVIQFVKLTDSWQMVWLVKILPHVVNFPNLTLSLYTTCIMYA